MSSCIQAFGAGSKADKAGTHAKPVQNSSCMMNKSCFSCSFQQPGMLRHGARPTGHACCIENGPSTHDTLQLLVVMRPGCAHDAIHLLQSRSSVNFFDAAPSSVWIGHQAQKGNVKAQWVERTILLSAQVKTCQVACIHSAFLMSTSCMQVCNVLVGIWAKPACVGSVLFYITP